jgi:hypothetical protein
LHLPGARQAECITGRYNPGSTLFTSSIMQTELHRRGRVLGARLDPRIDLIELAHGLSVRVNLYLQYTY